VVVATPPRRRGRRTRWWPAALVGAAVGILAWLVASDPVASVADPEASLGSGLSVGVFRSPDPRLQWSQVRGPEGALVLESLTATGDGFVVLSGAAGGARVWHSGDGVEWVASPLPEVLEALVVVGDELVGFRQQTGIRLRRSAAGWEPGDTIALPDWVRVGNGSDRPGLVVGPAGFLAGTISGELHWSGDGATFTPVITDARWGPGGGQLPRFACAPPAISALDVPPLVATDGGFVALVASDPEDAFGIWPVCEPRVWRSPDGVAWSPDAGAPPFGDAAYVYDLAWRDGRFVAAGGRGVDDPLVWVSDDAVSWTEIPFGVPGLLASTEVRSVKVGGQGWLVLGERVDRPGAVAWTSLDGLEWRRVPELGEGRVAAVGDEFIVIADRADLPRLWLARPSG
jgi:hypothetical protein